MNKKHNNFHYFREVGNTDAPVSIAFLFPLYNNTVRRAEEAHINKKIQFQTITL